MGVRKNIRKAKTARYAKGAKSRNKRRSERKVRDVKHDLWNSKDTLINNYTNWGILTDPNTDSKSKGKPSKEVSTTAFLEELKERADNAIKKPQKLHMAVEDKIALEKLIAKHGRENTEDMAEDKKLNIYFWNENQIKKMLARYDAFCKNN